MVKVRIEGEEGAFDGLGRSAAGVLVKHEEVKVFLIGRSNFIEATEHLLDAAADFCIEGLKRIPDQHAKKIFLSAASARIESKFRKEN